METLIVNGLTTRSSLCLVYKACSKLHTADRANQGTQFIQNYYHKHQRDVT